MENTTQRWLFGVRRHQALSGYLETLASDPGLEGVIWTPQTFRPSDAAGPIHRLIDAGARPDASLLWDISVETLRMVARADDLAVGVWMDPDTLADPKQAANAAVGVDVDLDVDNLVVCFSFSGARAGALTAILAEGIPVALSGVKSADEAQAVVRARAKALERLVKEEGEDAAEPVVYLLDGPATPELINVETFTVENLTMPVSIEDERHGRAAAVKRLASEAERVWPAMELLPQRFHNATRREVESRTGAWKRMWDRDHTLFGDEPDGITDRLGWLDTTAAVNSQLPALRELSTKGRKHSKVVLVGMGGSSLGAELLVDVLEHQTGLVVLDTTNPALVEQVLTDVDNALVVVSSKSGTTIETVSLAKILWERINDPSRFVYVTDPGSELEALGSSLGWTGFLNPADIGGRFSGLSLYGLVPAAACGVDVASVVDRLGHEVAANPFFAPEASVVGFWIGAAIAEAATSGEPADKITLLLPEKLRTFGSWLEQLVCESLGKDGRGVVAVLDNPATSADQFVVEYLLDSDEPVELDPDFMRAVVRIRQPADLVGHMWHWMVGVAVAGHILEIQPFDQPNVEESKRRAAEFLASGAQPDAGDLATALDKLPGDGYVAVQDWTSTPEAVDKLAGRLQQTLGRPVTVGRGPRYLHSTGQAHKGGPDSVVAVQVFEPPPTDIGVPGESHTLGSLFRAQADGDLEAMRAASREAVRVNTSQFETHLSERGLNG